MARSGFPRQLCSLRLSGRKTDLGTYTASCMAGSPHGKRERAKLTVAYILSWERNRVCGTMEAVGFPWRNQSPHLERRVWGRVPGAELVFLWPFHFPVKFPKETPQIQTLLLLSRLSDANSTPNCTIWQWFCGSFKKKVLSGKKIIFAL